MCNLVGGVSPDVHQLKAGIMLEVSATTGLDGIPDLSMLDLVFPRANLIETLTEAQQSCSKSLIVIVSMRDDRATIDQVFEYGTGAGVMKSIPAAALLDALIAGHAGEFAITRTNAVPEGDMPELAEVLALTKRQREILGLLRDGQSNKEIGRTLALSPFTVRNHISVLMRILRAHSRFELAALAASIIH